MFDDMIDHVWPYDEFVIFRYTVLQLALHIIVIQ